MDTKPPNGLRYLPGAGTAKPSDGKNDKVWKTACDVRRIPSVRCWARCLRQRNYWVFFSSFGESKYPVNAPESINVTGKPNNIPAKL